MPSLAPCSACCVASSKFSKLSTNALGAWEFWKDACSQADLRNGIAIPVSMLKRPSQVPLHKIIPACSQQSCSQMLFIQQSQASLMCQSPRLRAAERPASSQLCAWMITDRSWALPEVARGCASSVQTCSHSRAGA